MLVSHRPDTIRVITAVLLVLAAGACSGPPDTPRSGLSSDPPRPGASRVRAIRTILAADEAAGSRRNRAPESASLSRAVREYVAELEALDYDATPPDFAAAFRQHLDAWRASLEFFAAHDDMRGEMHDLFERIRALGPAEREALEAVEASIWGTWAEVEAAARRHGAIPDRPD